MGYGGDEGPATAAQLNRPSGIAVDAAGNLFVADSLNHRIRRVDPSGRITTVAGTGEAGDGGDGGPATGARLSGPSGVAVDAAGNVFVADTANHRVRRVDASGQITTVAGTGAAGYDGDDKPAAAARLNRPTGVAVDATGNLFIADAANHRIRRVDAVTGRITTVTGTGAAGYDGDDKPATTARLSGPTGVAVDAAGDLFVADVENQRVRRVDATTGRIMTVAGTGLEGYDGDDGPAATARLYSPFGVAVDAAGDAFVADTFNYAIRAVRQPGATGAGPAPSLQRVSFADATGKLVLRGSGFGASGAVVRVNGVDVSLRIRKQADRKIVLRGLAADLALRGGGNEITVTVGDRTSAVFPLFR
jgi:sugar lactone lactonase YvrE